MNVNKLLEQTVQLFKFSLLVQFKLQEFLKAVVMQFVTIDKITN